MDKSDYITLDINAEGEKRWKSGGIESVLNIWYGNQDKVVIGNKETENIIKHYLKTVETSDGSALSRIKRHQENIREKRLEKET